jgi:hypothetical protein
VGPDLIIDVEKGGGPNRMILAGKRTTHLVLLIFNILTLLVGQVAITLPSMYYFDNGGNNVWISTLLQKVGWPILLIHLVLYQGKKASKLTPLTPNLELIYVALCLWITWILNCILYSSRLSMGCRMQMVPGPPLLTYFNKFVNQSCFL